MAQHFLLTAAARTLSLKAIFRMSDDEAHSTFQAIRFASNCGSTEVYTYAARRIWKCKACQHQFSVTSGTIFASRKLPVRDYLAATAIFVSAVKGISALQLGRDLDVQYKTAFVLAHKLREAIAAEQLEGQLSGVVEVDGAYFGGHIKQENVKAERKDRRLAAAAKRTRTFVVAKESDAVALIRQCVAVGSTVHADEAAGWDKLHAFYEMKRINHSVAYSLDGACTNQAESYFSRLRRAEIGQHHHISGKYLGAYAVEMAWREDNRRVSNGAQHQAATGAALGHPVSRVWAGYWQRAVS